MPEDNDGFSFDDDYDASDDDDESAFETEKLKQQLAKIHKKFTGEDPSPATNDEILQFLRVINYNFVSLTRLLQAILLKAAETDTTLMDLKANTIRMDKRLQQFFETNSMLDDIGKEDFNASGSASDDKFTF